MAKNLDKLVSEVFEENKVLVHCQDHMYFARDLKTFPKHSCQKCWMAYYILLLGKSLPENREEKSYTLEAIVKKMAEQIGRGEIPGMLTGPGLVDN